jgi:hypothetical protein
MLLFLQVSYKRMPILAPLLMEAVYRRLRVP